MTDEPKPIRPGHLLKRSEALTLEEYRALDLTRPLTDGPVGATTGIKRENDNAASRAWDQPEDDYTELIHAAIDGARKRQEATSRKRQHSAANRDHGPLCVECHKRPKANKKAVCAECFNARRRKVPIRIVRPPKETA